MVPVPNYLEQYASGKKQKGNILSFKLKCTCGCEAFFIAEKKYTKDEMQIIREYKDNTPIIGGHSVYGGIDSDGKPYSYIKILGIFKKRIEFPQPPFFMEINVIKATCSQCQKEIVLFDNRYHGYDGMMSDNDELKKYTPLFEQRGSVWHNIEVSVENTSSLEAFNEVVGELYSYEFYSNSFSRIRICGLDERMKKRLLYDIETA